MNMVYVNPPQPAYPLKWEVVMPDNLSMVMPRPQESMDCRILPDVIKKYLDDCLISGRVQPEIVVNYRVGLNPWFAWWNECASQYDYKMSPAVFNDAYNWIRSDYRNTRGKPAANTTVYKCFAHLNLAFNWAHKNRSTGGINLAEWTPKLKRPLPNSYFPTPAEIKELMDAADDSTRIRDIAIIAFSASAGVRVSELCAIEKHHVLFDTPIECVSLGENHSGWCDLPRVKGDRGGWLGGRPVAFCSDAGLLLKIWMRSTGDPDSGNLFGLRVGGVQEAIRRIGKNAGNTRFSHHAFRRSYGDYYESKMGIEYERVLQRQLGHKEQGNVTQTHYVSKNKRRVVDELRKYHASPLELIKINWRGLPVHIPKDDRPNG